MQGWPAFRAADDGCTAAFLIADDDARDRHDGPHHPSRLPALLLASKDRRMAETACLDRLAASDGEWTDQTREMSCLPGRQLIAVG